MTCAICRQGLPGLGLIAYFYQILPGSGDQKEGACYQYDFARLPVTKCRGQSLAHVGIPGSRGPARLGFPNQGFRTDRLLDRQRATVQGAYQRHHGAQNSLGLLIPLDSDHPPDSGHIEGMKVDPKSFGAPLVVGAVQQDLSAPLPPLEAPRPEHLLDPAAQSLATKGHPLPFKDQGCGQGEREVVVLVTADEGGTQLIERIFKPLKRKTSANRLRGKVSPEKSEGRLPGLRSVQQRRQGFCRLPADDHRHPRLDDPRLLTRHLVQGCAEVSGMIEADRADDRHPGTHRIGGVETPPHSDFEDHEVDLLLLKISERQGRGKLEKGRRNVA